MKAKEKAQEIYNSMYLITTNWMEAKLCGENMINELLNQAWDIEGNKGSNYKWWLEVELEFKKL